MAVIISEDSSPELHTRPCLHRASAGREEQRNWCCKGGLEVPASLAAREEFSGRMTFTNREHLKQLFKVIVVAKKQLFSLIFVSNLANVVPSLNFRGRWLASGRPVA